MNVINPPLAYIIKENLERFAIAFRRLNLRSMTRAVLYSPLWASFQINPPFEYLNKQIPHTLHINDTKRPNFPVMFLHRQERRAYSLRR